VRDALAAIDEGRVSKVVLARTLDVITETRLDPIEVVRNLWTENRGSHAFYFEPEEGCALLGAAPETVTTVSEGRFHATAVAGTVARGESASEQQRFAELLLASAKEGVEHRIALDDMVARLGSLADEIHAQSEPHVLTLARIQHLETEIRARLPEGTSALTVLDALHPTPAVCGLPRDAAFEFLENEEPFERGWYAGPVGWFDLDGNGVFVPALRCAVVRDLRWRLFAGAGIVEGSDPGLEWDETSIKFEPMLRALAASGAR
jgi:menaquinone-specific isochorismate synthase